MKSTSIDRASKTLDLAYDELRKAKTNPEKQRQAAEKAWRAAREAVSALMRFGGRAPKSAAHMRSDRVSEFESIVLRRNPRGPQPLTALYVRAMTNLHGQCFYGDDCKALYAEFEQVEYLIEHVRDEMRYLAQRGARRR